MATLDLRSVTVNYKESTKNLVSTICLKMYIACRGILVVFSLHG